MITIDEVDSKLEDEDSLLNSSDFNKVSDDKHFKQILKKEECKCFNTNSLYIDIESSNRSNPVK
jgi:hypothetical protein